MCLHCPRCSTDDLTVGQTCEMPRACRPCQNKFGKNARIMGGTFGMAESLVACTEHQGNDTPHIHGLMAVVCPYQYKTLLEIRDLIQHDMTEFDRIKRFIENMCQEDHFDNEAHQASLPSLEKAKSKGLAGASHIRLSAKPSFLQPRCMPATQPSLWETNMQKD